MKNEITAQKSALRKIILKERDSLDASYKNEYDQWICDELYKLIKAKQFRVIHTYLPIRSEIDILPLIEKLIDENYTIISPKTLAARKLEHFILSDVEKLETGLFGTLYPHGNTYFEEETYDLIIIPGVAFGEQRYRLGYGGGYYDNFLEDHPLAYKVGLCYPFQVVKDLPKEEHDAKLDFLLYRSVDR
ncbi:5-formyltetrahydrofolate cyclo-ligase [Portibacter lacus]|uniref:5-formyltetrahydrofolate cyclo-ligase n=1 Tax=Portibacter lacus TaxID=1099794 RepID=A0AA37SQL2_9BACT|nr:5-formyltetrahydrofolate cyclo-ligase [Portibacter lacus]GLR15875.1 5-formyltetrahydrofolate cyclo-ligase [Portibacter lacus]